MFWERQEGGLCRKHSLNAFYQESKISTQDFIEWNKKYSIYLEEKYGNKVEIIENDIVYSNDIGIIPFILQRIDKIYCFHFAINQIKETFKQYNILNIVEWLNDNESLFIYNANHIWAMKKEKGIWYKIDSLSGISSNQCIKSLFQEKNIGIIVPRNKKFIKTDIEAITFAIKRFLLNQNINNNIDTILKIKEILDNLIKNGKNVDWLEPMVGLYMNILQVKTEITEDENNLLEEYNKFLVYYENHKNDTEYLLNNFSNIINKINTLQ